MRDRVVEILARHFLDRAFKRGRVAEGLARGGQHGRDARDGGLKAHVEHAVHFVEDQDLDLVETNQPALEVVLEAAGGGDDKARAAANGVELRALVHAAHHQGHGLRGAGADGEKCLLHLHGQLARGQQNEGVGRRSARC